jgi:hypothetical protein
MSRGYFADIAEIRKNSGKVLLLYTILVIIVKRLG